MKVLLLGFGKIAYMPYMNFYLDALKEKDIEFELIYWDRDGKQDAEVPSRILRAYKFEAHLEEQLPFKNKLKYFIQYRRFALQILKKNKYDSIIVLHTTPGLTLLDYLSQNYKGKYILDFRDVSYEYILIYRKLVGYLSKKSAITFVSSNAFRKFLPKQDDVYTVHNFLEDSLNKRGLRAKEPRARNVLRVSYWGLVRQVEVNKKLISALGNDPRFELHYYGRMQQDGRNMQEYAKTNGYKNVFFHGGYMPADRYTFASQTDIIHNVYDTGYTTGNAMGNKYYDGIIFGIPQICTAGSFMGDRIEKEDVGIVIALDDSQLADRLWKYYTNMDWKKFDANCNKATISILEEQAIAQGVIKRFIHK